MLNFLGLSSDSARDLRRRRYRLGRFASEGTVEIKVLIFWGGVLKFWRWPSGSAGELASQEVSFRASLLGGHRWN